MSKGRHGIKTWQLEESTISRLYRLLVDPLNSNIIFAQTRTNGMFVSINNGRSWEPINSGLNSVFMAAMTFDNPKNPSNLYIGTHGVYVKPIDKYRDSLVINMDIPSGWSMISLPVRLDNQTLSVLFPDARVVYGYEKGIGYKRVQDNEELKDGMGYWILFDEVQSYSLTGQPIDKYSTSVTSGWYMIGGCTSSANASVNQGNIVVIYKYIRGIGYQRVVAGEKLEQGQGYWILINNIAMEAMLTVE